MKNSRWIICVAICAVLAGACQGPTPPIPAPTKGFPTAERPKQVTEQPVIVEPFERIAYSIYSNGRSITLHMINADGTGNQLLVDNPEDRSVDNMTWSPDHLRLAFDTLAIDRDLYWTSTPSVYIINQSGSDLFRLTEGAYPSWSPDGKRIAFIRRSGEGTGNFALYITNPKPEAEEIYLSEVTTPINWFPDGSQSIWSPDGLKIAFVNGSLSTINSSDGSGLAELIPSFYHVGTFHWSPDGKYLLFNSNPPYQSDIYTVRVSDGDLINLTSTKDIIESNPEWSPDGNWIVYDAGGQIYISTPFKGTSRPLTGETEKYVFPNWSPDGRWIMYRAEPGNNEIHAQYWIMDRSGSNKHKLTQDSNDYVWALWSPDSTRVALLVKKPDGMNDLLIHTISTGNTANLTNSIELNEWSPCW